MPTVDEFVAAAEWVRERGWRVKPGLFINRTHKCLCPLSALAWQRSGGDTPPSATINGLHYSLEFQTLVDMNSNQIGAFVAGFDRPFLVGEMRGRQRGVKVYKALTERGLL